jgi:aspartate/methionine/tyrosine aminotransferase
MPRAEDPSESETDSDSEAESDGESEDPRPRLSQTASAMRASVFSDLAPHIEAYARRGGDLVELHIGDTHVPPPEAARFARALREREEGAYDASLYRYGAISGLESLKEAFCARAAAAGFGPHEARPPNVLVGCGATHALFCAVRAVLDPGDEVLVSAPYWPLSVGVLRAAGAIPVEVPLTTRLAEDPALDPAALLAPALTPRTRAVYLITPNNPDGKVLSPAHLSSIARLARERGLWVIADEVYADYVYDGVHTSIARLDGMAERTLSVYSLSKSHSLAGVRIGFALAPERVVTLARRIATHTVFNVPVACQRVALAALSAPPQWLEAARRSYREARDRTVEALGELANGPPEGGSYVFLDFRALLAGPNGARPLTELLGRAIDRGVLLAPGDGFGDAYSGWARLCFTSAPLSRVLEGVARLKAAVQDLNAAPGR